MEINAYSSDTLLHLLYTGMLLSVAHYQATSLHLLLRYHVQICTRSQMRGDTASIATLTSLAEVTVLPILMSIPKSLSNALGTVLSLERCNSLASVRPSERVD